MRKLAELSSPLWKYRPHFQLTNRHCQLFGIFILVSALFFFINQTKFARQFDANIFSITMNNTTSFESISHLGQRDCPFNLTVVKEAPSSLPCGMTVNVLGRLGNLMGQYATLLALSEMNNKTAVLLPNMGDILRLYFKISLPNMEPDERSYWESKWTVVLVNDWMEPRLREIKQPFSYLYGYPCSWTFYHHVRDRILQEFQFHDHILERTQKVLNHYRRGRESVTFIGVHNRRSDYVLLMAGQYRGVVADAEFFQRAFDYFESKYRDAVFLVVSDDMEWCQENMKNSKGNIYFVGNGNNDLPIYDLALMANCNHSIITIGTFGYWGAYLAGGETVYLTNYTLTDSPFLKVLKYEDFYLPEWIPIAANLSGFKEPEETSKTS